MLAPNPPMRLTEELSTRERWTLDPRWTGRRFLLLLYSLRGFCFEATRRTPRRSSNCEILLALVAEGKNAG